MKKTVKITKSTTIEGCYATEDMDGVFCFDTHKGPDEHRAASKGVSGERRTCRTYPEDLLPDGILSRRGRWTITVEFEPYETTPKN